MVALKTNQSLTQYFVGQLQVLLKLALFLCAMLMSTLTKLVKHVIFVLVVPFSRYNSCRYCCSKYICFHFFKMDSADLVDFSHRKSFVLSLFVSTSTVMSLFQ